MSILTAILFGFLLGFVLQKVGAANPVKIIGMLRLKDFHLMKAIFLGIGISSLALFILLAFDIVSSSNISVKSSYIGVIVGGGILGLGWAIAGFCPGTGVTAAGAGRKDAFSFIVGGLLGAFLFMVIYEPLKESVFFNSLGGKVTLAITGNQSFQALLPNLPGIIVAGAIAVLFIIIAWKLPYRSKA